jgi:flagellar basal-body rod modification protein FlgD
MEISLQNALSNQTLGSNQPANKNQLGQQQFLQLLVAQMRHQDPSNPMNGAEFASQLAQFNSVEQLINVNSGIRSLQQSQDIMGMGLTNSLAASLTGKHVTALSNQIHLSPAEGSQIKFKLAAPASDVEIVIRNSAGAEVRRIPLQQLDSGDNQFHWDGLSNSGDRMPEGTYTVSISAKSGENNVQSLTYLEGLATKVRFTPAGVFLKVNGIDVPIGNVEELSTPPQ